MDKRSKGHKTQKRKPQLYLFTNDLHKATCNHSNYYVISEWIMDIFIILLYLMNVLKTKSNATFKYLCVLFRVCEVCLGL